MNPEIGRPNHYPDSKHEVIVSSIVREEKLRAWREFKGVAFGDALITCTSPAYAILVAVAELEGIRDYGLVGLVDRDGKIVHYGSLRIERHGIRLAG